MSIVGDDGLCQYDSSNIYKFYKEDFLDNDQNDDDDENLTPFESMAAKMENLTADGGVKKQTVRHGVGEVVPPGSSVTG